MEIQSKVPRPKKSRNEINSMLNPLKILAVAANSPLPTIDITTRVMDCAKPYNERLSPFSLSLTSLVNWDLIAIGKQGQVGQE